MDELTLLADLHKAGLRQGPGSPDVTRRAMVLAGLDGSRPLEIADIGCGTGGTEAGCPDHGRGLSAFLPGRPAAACAGPRAGGADHDAGSIHGRPSLHGCIL